MLPECRNVGIISSMLVSGMVHFGPPRDSTEDNVDEGGICDVYVVRTCTTFMKVGYVMCMW